MSHIPDSKPMHASRITISQLMQPEHANHHGNVHGGWIMKLVDEAGALACMRHAQHRVVTVAIDQMIFKQPIQIGDLIIRKSTRPDVPLSKPKYKSPPKTRSLANKSTPTLPTSFTSPSMMKATPPKSPRCMLKHLKKKSAWKKQKLAKCNA